MKLENKIVYCKEMVVSTSDILARKLEQEPLSYCKIIAESEGFNQ
jgi:hypothetical protein